MDDQTGRVIEKMPLNGIASEAQNECMVQPVVYQNKNTRCRKKTVPNEKKKKKRHKIKSLVCTHLLAYDLHRMNYYCCKNLIRTRGALN